MPLRSVGLHPLHGAIRSGAFQPAATATRETEADDTNGSTPRYFGEPRAMIEDPRQPGIPLSDFQDACRDCGLSMASSDLGEARAIWRTLDFEQQLAAIEGLRARHEAGEFTDRAYLPLPQNWLRKKLWERPMKSDPLPGAIKPLQEYRMPAQTKCNDCGDTGMRLV